MYIVRSDAGEALRMVGATMDITERKRAERAYNTQLLNSSRGRDLRSRPRGHHDLRQQVGGGDAGLGSAELVGGNMHATAHQRQRRPATPIRRSSARPS